MTKEELLELIEDEEDKIIVKELEVLKKKNKNPTGNSYFTKAKLAIKNYNLAKNRDVSSYAKANTQDVKRYKK